MIGREARVLLRHYLEQGMSKAAIARQGGVSRRTVYRWIESGQLDLAALPPENVLSMIASFAQARTAEALEELAGSLAERVEVIGKPELAGAFAA